MVLEPPRSLEGSTNFTAKSNSRNRARPAAIQTANVLKSVGCSACAPSALKTSIVESVGRGGGGAGCSLELDLSGGRGIFNSSSRLLQIPIPNFALCPDEPERMLRASRAYDWPDASSR